MTMPDIKDVETLGFAVIPNLLTEGLRQDLAALFEEDRRQAGRRDGLFIPTVRAAATSEPVRAIVQAVLGKNAFATKATLFDKTTKANWLAPWHQDVTIPVRERQTTPGYEAWSIKGGVPYTRPPLQVLESMVAVRLDLDGTTKENGPLHVLPGTHNRGFLTPDEIQYMRLSQPPVTCLVPASGGLLMRPLLLHASSKASSPAHRRIVHIEFASSELPGAIDWHERCALTEPINQAMHPDDGCAPDR